MKWWHTYIHCMSLDRNGCKLQFDWLVETYKHEAVFLVLLSEILTNSKGVWFSRSPILACFLCVNKWFWNVSLGYLLAPTSLCKCSHAAPSSSENGMCNGEQISPRVHSRCSHMEWGFLCHRVITFRAVIWCLCSILHTDMRKHPLFLCRNLFIHNKAFNIAFKVR